MTETRGIDPSVPPSGTGCVECDAEGGWWVHLRRCAELGISPRGQLHRVLSSGL
jgi:hypothetical protein